MTGDGTTTISTPSDVHCNHCDHVNRNVDIFDDLRTGDWAYLFECVSCERINDEHGSNLERGSSDVVFTIVAFVAAVLLISAWGRNWDLFWAVTWIAAAVAAVAAYVYFIAAVMINGAQPEEENHE